MTIMRLAGHDVHRETVTGSKLVRASSLSAQVEAGNVVLVRGSWNENFLSVAHGFDGVRGRTDEIDAAAGAFNKLTLPGKPRKRGGTWGRRRLR